MFKAWFLRLHRWGALLFAIPLAVVVVTGLVLSFEPWIAQSAIKPGALTPAKIEALLARHDAKGEARAIAYRSYDNTVTIGGRSGQVVDVATGEARSAPSGMAQFLVTARRMHESLLLDLSWLVVASSYAMLVLALLGVLMGWPRISNTLSGWHKGMSWGLLPLLVLSPLTGIFIYMGVSFTSPPALPAAQGPPLKLIEAVRIAGARHDLSGLVWLRPQRGQLMMRVIEGGEYKVVIVTRAGTVQTERNWPRLWHEGNFAGVWSALMNVVLSFAMVGLMITGLWIWARRKLRLRARRAERLATAG